VVGRMVARPPDHYDETKMENENEKGELVFKTLMHMHPEGNAERRRGERTQRVSTPPPIGCPKRAHKVSVTLSLKRRKS
jgi:hypothetical protein